MSKSAFHIDLSLLEPANAGDDDLRSQRVTRFAGAIVSFASLLPPGEIHTSAVPCRRRPKRRPCSGRLEVGRESSTDEIQWHCPECRDCGMITGWRHSHWDLTPEVQSGQIISLLQRQAFNSGRSINGRRVRVLELEAELIGGPVEIEHRITRRLSIAADKTLHDLHELMRTAFDWKEDQPYDFMFGAPYEPGSRRFTGGIDPDDADASDACETRVVSLESLDLQPGQHFGYLFDFGEEWVHRVTLAAAREVVGHGTRPKVVSRCGMSPPQHPDADDEWDDDALWAEVDEDYPMTGLYGPYQADEGVTADVWGSLDDLERILLVCEAHARELPDGHPPIHNMFLHGLIHCVAESSLIEGGDCKSAAVNTQCPDTQSPNNAETRHGAIHQIGEQIVRHMLGTTPPCDKPDRRRKRRGAPGASRIHDRRKPSPEPS